MNMQMSELMISDLFLLLLYSRCPYQIPFIIQILQVFKEAAQKLK